MQSRKTIDDVIRFITVNAPPEGTIIKKNPFRGKRFYYTLVDGAIRELHAQGRFLDLEAYDIKSVLDIWNAEEGKNYELARRATKNLLNKLRQDNPKKTLVQILTKITQKTFHNYSINRYHTTLNGMLQRVYEDSPYEALKDLIYSRPELAKYKDFQPYDMKCAPMKTWNKKDGSKNYKLARHATKTLLNKLQTKRPNKTLTQILTEITENKFFHFPINKYKTVLSGMLGKVYDNSPYDALKDLIDNDPEFAEYRDLQPYDMKISPQNTWKNKDGSRNYELARHATKTLLKKLQMDQPQKTLTQILTEITKDTFSQHPINKYHTTLAGMITKVYKGSPYQAVKDLIEKDPKFAEYKDLQPYDMNQAPKETWVNRDGSKNYEFARHATKTLLNKLYQENPSKTRAQILTGITQDTFHLHPINRYQTTLGGMIKEVYEGSPYQALKNLAENDPEYTEFLPVIEELRHKGAA